MALQKQIVPIGFASGIQSKPDPKQLQAGQMVDVQNGVFTNPGTIRKRFGLSSSITTPSGVGTALATRGSELLVADGSNLYTYSTAETTILPQASFASYTLTTQANVSSAYSVGGYDTAIAQMASGAMVQCCVYELYQKNLGGASSGYQGCYYTIIDVASGAVLVPQTAILANTNSGSGGPKVLVVNNATAGNGSFLISYVDATSNPILKAGTIALSALSTPPSYVSITGISTPITTAAMSAFGSYCYDVFQNGTKVYWAYSSGASGPGNGVATVISANVGTPTTPAAASAALASPVTGVGAICIFEDVTNSRLAVAHIDNTTNTNAYLDFFSLVPALTSGGIAIETSITGTTTAIAGVWTTGLLTFFYSARDKTNAGAVGSDFTRTNTYTSGGGSGTASTYMEQVTICGKPVLINGKINVPVTLDAAVTGVLTSPQNTWFLGDSAGNIIAKCFSGTAGGYYFNNTSTPGNTSGTPTAQMMPESIVSPINSAIYYFPLLNATRQTVLSGGITGSTFIPQFSMATASVNTIDTNQAYCRVELAGSTHFSGAAPFVYDGRSLVEQGYYVYPSVRAISQSGAGNVAIGLYQYIVCYEWLDEQGQIHRSTPSVPVSITTTSATQVMLTIPYLYLTRRKSGVQITVYRTEANGTVFYQANNVGMVNNINVMTGGPIPQTFVYTDNTTSYLGNPTLYTSGNVVEDYAPNPLGHMVVHRDRIFALDTTNPNSIWFTKQWTPGNCVEWSLFFTMTIDPRGGALTALSEMDDVLLLFKQSRIFRITGQGPDNTGAQNDFQDATFVSSDVGCLYPGSVVVMPNGVMFQSQKGIYLIDRSLELNFIGSPIDNYLSGAANANPQTPLDRISSATVTPYTTQIRFTSNTRLASYVYDYVAQQWSFFSISTRFGASIVDGIIWNGQYVLLDDAGELLFESINSYYDDNSTIPVSLRLQTGWISLAGVQGFQRLYTILLLGDYYAANTLTFSIAYDFEPTPSQVVTINPGVNSPGSAYQARIYPNRQKCEAIQITIADATSMGQGFDLSSISLEVGVKRGQFKLPAAKSFG